MKHNYYKRKRLNWIVRLIAWFNLSGAHMIRLALEKPDPFRDLRGLT